MIKPPGLPWGGFRDAKMTAEEWRAHWRGGAQPQAGLRGGAGAFKF